MRERVCSPDLRLRAGWATFTPITAVGPVAFVVANAQDANVAGADFVKDGVGEPYQFCPANRRGSQPESVAFGLPPTLEFGLK